MGLKLWRDCTLTDFENIDPDKTVALLPVGAIEPHGHHLPMSTDSVIAEEMCHRAAELVPDDIPLLVLPTQEIGKSNEHGRINGTLTHSAKTLMDSWMEIGESAYKSGIKKIVFFNAHGGQPQIMEICCRELRIKYDMVAVGCSGWSFGNPDTPDVPEDERKYGIHAGQVETAIMLYLTPDLVHMEHAQNFQGLLQKVDARYKHLSVLGKTYMGWQSHDVHPLGCSGDATLATAELGKLYVDHYVDGLSKMLVEVSDYPLEWIIKKSDQ